MGAMEKPSDLLNELIGIARDGERFYLDAAGKVGNLELQVIFREMAQVRQKLIEDLSQHVEARGAEPSQEGTLLGRMHTLYTDTLAALRRDNERIWVAQLEDAEDRLLEQYQAALRDAPSENIRAILERHLLTVRATHDSMKALKQQLSPA